MSGYKFYYPDGTEISKGGADANKQEFIRFYSESYFLVSKDGQPVIRVANAGQSSRYAEEKIESILHDGIRCETDVARLLAWKIGKIKHRDTEEASEFRYAKDWAEAERFNVRRYGKPFKLKEIAEYLVENIKELEKESDSCPQDVLLTLRDEFARQEINGIGTVYLITLLYFISKGKYPIYDRFAMMALDAIVGEKSVKTCGMVKYHALPDKTSAEFSNVVKEHLDPYMCKLKDIFGESIFDKENRTNRDIDRALWVYGHCFRIDKKK